MKLSTTPTAQPPAPLPATSPAIVSSASRQRALIAVVALTPCFQWGGLSLIGLFMLTLHHVGSTIVGVQRSDPDGRTVISNLHRQQFFGVRRTARSLQPGLVYCPSILSMPGFLRICIRFQPLPQLEQTVTSLLTTAAPVCIQYDGSKPASSAWASNTTSSHSASLSSLLDPSGQNGSSYPRGPPGPRQMSYTSPFTHGPGHHSPDSRPNTGYSAISAYNETASPTSYAGFDYSRPNLSHHRGVSPGSSRPGSSHRANPGNCGQAVTSLRIRRARRHSQATSPYQSPYGDDGRPLTVNQAEDRVRDIGLPRSRSMISINHHPKYSYNPTHATGDFTYNAGERSLPAINDVSPPR